jgi:hypothetical protein
MMERAFRRIDRDVREIRAAEPFQLGVEIGEVAALQQRIVGEVDPGRHILRHERDLLGLGEEIVRHAVQHEPADRDRRQHSSGISLGGIQNIEFETVGESLIEQLKLQFPFRKVAGLNGGPQIAAMEVGIGAVDFHGLVPEHRLHAQLRLPVKLDERRFALRIDEAEGVDAKPFHEAERARDGAIRHHPHDHVHAFGRQADEIPEIVVRRLRLRKSAVGLLLDRMNHVRKLDGVLDEEHRNVVADDVPVAFLGIELDGKAAHVARQVRRALAAGNRGEPHEGRRFLAGALEQIGAGVFRLRLVVFEEAMCAVAAGVDDALRDPLMVEMENLLPEMKILDQGRTARTDLERILVIRDRTALGGGQHRDIATGGLMKFAPSPRLNF